MNALGRASYRSPVVPPGSAERRPRHLAVSEYQVIAPAWHAETLAGLDSTIALELDVNNAGSIHAAVDAVLQRHGRIGVLVNNAGYARRGTIEEWTATRLSAYSIPILSR